MDPQIDIAVIPVAGLGTRLLPATKSQPKEMLPVGRKPVVQYVVEELTRVGMTRVLFVTGPGKASIENHFDRDAELIQTLRETGKEELLAALEFERSTVQYFYTRQRELLGLGHAISCARSFVGRQPFVVALGDSIIGMHAGSDIVQRMTRCYHERQAAAVIAFEEVPHDEVSHYGIARPKDDGELFEIADLVEKPSVREAPSNLAIAARYVLSPAIFDALARTRRGQGGEIQLTDAIRAVIRDGGRAYGVRLRADERRYDIGNFQAYFEAFVAFALADPAHGPAFRRHLLEALDVSHS
jgi:UTP--glucose-1-phosphate uridylyltransferase